MYCPLLTVWGVSDRGWSLFRGVSVQRRVSVKGRLCPGEGGLCSGGLFWVVSVKRVSVQGVSLTETPKQEHGARDRDLPGRNIGPANQTGSDIIQRPHPPVNRMTHASKNIALPQNFVCGR